MAEKYKQPIGNVPATVLKLLLNIAGAFTKRITHEPSRLIVDGFVGSFSELVAALSDADPNDSVQIKAVVHKLLTEGDFYEGSRQTILANIEKIENEDVQNALLIATNITYQVAELLTDEVADNGAQVEAMLRDFLSSPEGVQFITSMLRLILDESTASIIALLLIEALKGVLSDDQKEALEDLRLKLQEQIA